MVKGVGLRRLSRRGSWVQIPPSAPRQFLQTTKPYEIEDTKQISMSKSTAKKAWQIIGLAADTPFPAQREKLALFGQFVGDWDIIEARYPQPNGTPLTRRGEVHFGWILDGRAIQDVWMAYDGKEGRVVPIGTTIRFYDPKIDAWHSVWLNPVGGYVQEFVARKVGEEIVLEGKTVESGFPEQWIFSNITADSFRWHAEETHDSGKTWILTEEMQIRRH